MRAALLLLVGCGRLGFGSQDEPPDASNGGDAMADGSAVVPGCAPDETPTTFSSTFDTSIPAWADTYGAQGGLVIVNGGLEVSPDPSAGSMAYWGIIHATPTDHRGHRAFIEVSRMTNTATTTQVLFRVVRDDEWAQIFQSDGQLVTETRVAGVNSTSYASYDPDAHRWWQLREDAGTVYFETSPNGTTWTVVYARPTPAIYATGNLEAAAGFFEPQTMALGVARFDNLFVCD